MAPPAAVPGPPLPPPCDDAEAPAPEPPLAAEESTPDDVAAARFYHKLCAAPWGVLGLQLPEHSEHPALHAREPDEETAIVDPAGLTFIQVTGFVGASGASGAIYRFLGLQDTTSFPQDVVSAVKVELQAKLHSYGKYKVIHAVGPDLRQELYQDAESDEIVEALAAAFASVLREFADSGLRRLRLLPLSGGILSGRFGPELPSLTIGALGAAFLQLDPRQQEQVLDASAVELCIYLEREFPTYADQLVRVQRALEPHLPRRTMSTLASGRLRTSVVAGQPLPRAGEAPSRGRSSVFAPLAGAAPACRSSLSLGSGASMSGAVAGEALKRLCSQELLEESPEGSGAPGAERPLSDEQLRFATELQLGDRPGSGFCLLRTDAEGSGKPAARLPPPDISALSDMRLLKQRAKARLRDRSPKLDKSSKLRQDSPAWDGWGSKVQAEPEPEEEADEGSGKLQFDPDWTARTIKLSPDRHGASWSGRPYGGVAVSLEIVRKQVVGRYFELQIEDSDALRWQDGLGLGVCVKPNQEAIHHVRDIKGQFEGFACELLPHSWLLGYDGGRAKLCGHQRYLTAGEMPRGMWRPKELKSGDVLALLVTPEGHMMLFVNDELRVMAQFCEGLETHWRTPLHAAVDLDGCTKSVRLLDTNGTPSKKVMLAHAKFREAEFKAKHASDAGLEVGERP